MGYVIVGGICLVAGACIGMVTLALFTVNENTTAVKPKAEREIYMGTCSLGATHNVPEVDKDEDR